MLDPRQRQVYLEALRPPDGFRLDRAIGTTYSLDLLALLVAPVSFALFDCDGWEDALRDPLSLMEALQRNARRMTLFCQVGQIHVPRFHHVLFSELEDMVVEVRAPSPSGVFHPKTWTLRFIDEDGHVTYRFLCLSRNLTFDRSWDLVFAIEGTAAAPTAGEPDARRVDSEPIADFLAALPTLAVERPVAERVQRDVDLMQSEIRAAALDLPGDVPFDRSALRFHPLGIPGHTRWPLADSGDRVLVVSPFLSDGPLRRLTSSGTRHVLVSRTEAIDSLSSRTVDRFDQRLILDDAAGADAETVVSGETTIDEVSDDTAIDGAQTGQPPASAPPSDEREGDEEQPSPPAADDDDDARGLHAKLFVVESGATARLWVGSANATAAALLQDAPVGPSRNVEFLVELAGPAAKVGIDAILQSTDDKAGLRDLLVPWRPPEQPDEVDEAAAAIDERLTQCARVIADSPPRLRAERVADDQYDLVLFWADGTADSIMDRMSEARATGRCWPVTLPESQARPLGGPDTAAETRFPGLSTVGLSRFIAFDLSSREGSTKRHRRFVLKLNLAGEPEDRAARLLHHVLSDRVRFLRYLLMLLAESDTISDAMAATIRVGVDGRTSHGGDGRPAMPLLEELVRACARHPDRITRVKRLVDELRSTPEGQQVLPDGFDDVWKPIEELWDQEQGS